MKIRKMGVDFSYVFAVALSVAVCQPFLAFAEGNPLERIEIMSPNPVGSGARALGMGGAFIPVADDATAASWNPGGLIQLEKPEISIVTEYTHRSEANTFAMHPEATSTGYTDDANVNYLSAAYPFEAFGKNMIVSLNYQQLYDFNRDWSFSYIFDSTWQSNKYKYEQEGDIYALGLAYAVRFTPDFSAGATLNYWGDFINENKWKQKYHNTGALDLGGISGIYDLAKKEEYDFEGWNMNLGFLWRMTEHLTAGGVLKAPFKADISHRITRHESTSYPDFPDANVVTNTSDRYGEDLRMPMSLGFGLAYRFSDAFTVAADFYHTQWSHFEYEDSQGNRLSPISGKENADISDTTWFRLGCEYLFIGEKFTVPVRAGVFYDPAPSDDSPDDYYGFALGTGIAYKNYVFDIAYQYKFGNDVGGSTLEDIGFSQDVEEHTVYSSLIVHF